MSHGRAEQNAQFLTAEGPSHRSRKYLIIASPDCDRGKRERSGRRRSKLAAAVKRRSFVRKLLGLRVASHKEGLAERDGARRFRGPLASQLRSQPDPGRWERSVARYLRRVRRRGDRAKCWLRFLQDYREVIVFSANLKISDQFFAERVRSGNVRGEGSFWFRIGRKLLKILLTRLRLRPTRCTA
jgi:hypothetical protein